MNEEHERQSLSARVSRAFRSVVLASAVYPKLALVVALAISIAAAALIPGLQISTSRTDLVSASNPHQRRLLQFYERFGYPDNPVIVVTGGTEESRRRFVDLAVERLEEVPELRGRVLARIGADSVADVALLNAPEDALVALDGVADPASVIAGGLPAWISAVNVKMSAELESGGSTDPDAAKEGLRRLTLLVRSVDDEVQGRSATDRLSEVGAASVARPGVDARGYLIGEDAHVVALFPTLEGDEGVQVTPLIQRIRGVRDRVIAEHPELDVRADVTGLPALVTDELATVQEDLKLTSALSTIAIALSLYFAFRSVRQASVSFLPIGFGTLATMGLARLVFGKLNLITTSFTSVLLGIGDFGVHIQARYAELMRAGVARGPAMETALLKAGPGLLVGTVMTAVAFLTTTATEFTAFAQLGLLTCIGLIVMLFGTYLLIPPMTWFILGKAPKPAPEIPGMRLLGRFVRRFPKQILAISAVVTVLFAANFRGIEFNARYFELLPKDAESSRGLLAIEHDPVLTPLSANVTADSIEEARTIAARLRALDSVGAVESPSDFLPELDENRTRALRALDARVGDGLELDRLQRVSIPELKAALGRMRDTVDEVAFATRQAGRDDSAVRDLQAACADLGAHLDLMPVEAEERLSSLQTLAGLSLTRALDRVHAVATRGEYSPEDVPALWRNRYVSKDGRSVALYVHPRYDIWGAERSEQFVREVEGITDQASGLAMTLSEHPRMIVRGFERSTVIASFVVIGILYLSFRNLRDMVIAAVPLVMGTVWMLGSMGPLDLQLDHANVVVVPLLLGLGVDAGVHLMVRYRQSAADSGSIADIDEILCSTGGGVLVASATTVFGFAVMALAKYRGMVHLGIIMTIGMSATLVLTLLVIPAILVVRKLAR